MSDRLTYAPGEWYGVVGPRVLVVLPPAEKARVGAIWALADEGADLDETLDALIATGLRTLSGFVLVGVDDAGATRIVVRGEALVTAEAGGSTHDFDGTTASTWVEGTLLEVSRLVIDVADVAAGAPSHTLEQGLVRVSRLVRGEAAGAPTTSADAFAPPPVALAPLAEPPVVEPVVAPVPAAPSVAAVATPAVAPATGLDPDAPEAAAHEASVVDTWEEEPAPVVDAALTDDLPEATSAADEEDELPEPELVGTDAYEDAGVGAAPEPGEPRDFDAVFDTHPAPADPIADDGPLEAGSDGGLWAPTPVEPAAAAAFSSSAPADDDLPTEAFAAVPPPAPASAWDAPAIDSSSDHDGQTQLAPFDDDDLAPIRPGIPGQPPAPAVTARPVARLVVAGGETVDVDRAVLVGRAPAARRAGSLGEEPLLVRVDSPHQEISSTHLEVRPGSGADHGTAVVTDLGSTNGTVVIQPGLEPEELQPGVSVQLIPGAVIDLGDGVTIQVSQP